MSADDRLRSEAALGRSLLQQDPNGILVVGPDGRVRYVNPSFRRMVELRAPPEGRRPIDVIPLSEIQQAVDQALSRDHAEEVGCSSGRFDLLIRPVRTEDGGALVFVQDVTRFRLAERARTDFVSNVSHELRTPITSIMGYAETLLAESGRLQPDQASMADAIYRNGRRLRDVFEDLLELARIEARGHELPLSWVLLHPVLERAVSPAADVAARRRQDFALDCAEDLEAWVNEEALATIVGNLAMNATNYTPDCRRIRVHAFTAGPELVVEVEDDGIGIDQGHHERIFERFYRVDEGRSRRLGGTGLGLAIVKHLALACGGRVAVRSEPGKGSTFLVRLPAEPGTSVIA
jgi:two-component system phosphate regulon sensor histidine kinase PhoR